MNAVRKKRMQTVLKYTWPVYLVLTAVIILLLNFIFVMTHQTPAYKSLTLFVSGEVTDTKKLRSDLLEKYQDKELKTVSIISAKPNEGHYYTKLSVPGYNSADILIIPESILDNLKVDTFGLEINQELKDTYYSGLTTYQQENIAYGIKLNKEKVKEYMAFTNEDHYMVLNARSENIGSYSTKQIKERDNALNLVKEWGM